LEDKNTQIVGKVWPSNQQHARHYRLDTTLTLGSLETYEDTSRCMPFRCLRNSIFTYLWSIAVVRIW